MELSNYPNSNTYLYNYQTETAIFIATKHEKSYLNFCKYFFHFELLASNIIKNETGKKFRKQRINSQ